MGGGASASKVVPQKGEGAGGANTTTTQRLKPEPITTTPGVQLAPLSSETAFLKPARTPRAPWLRQFMNWQVRGKKRRIEVTDKFHELYKLKGQVVPSSHNGMQILHAIRCSDDKGLVIKLRQKAKSFVSKEEETEWRTTMELLLNLPRNESLAEIIEVLEDHEAYYVVMEQVQGQDLFETLQTGDRAMDRVVAKEVIRQLLLAVASLHESGCIHKDLKLENVMLERTPKAGGVSATLGFPKSPRTPGAASHSPSSQKGSKPGSLPNGKSAGVSSDSQSRSNVDGSQCGNNPWTGEPVNLAVKLIDFDTLENITPRGTRSKVVVGTDQYIAQEAYGGRYSPLSDVFAVGVIAYRLLCGHFPFDSSMFDDEAGENWVGSPKMREIQERLRVVEVEWQRPPFITDRLAADLLRRMIHSDESKRPDAVTCLHHRWFHQEEAAVLQAGLPSP